MSCCLDRPDAAAYSLAAPNSVWGIICTTDTWLGIFSTVGQDWPVELQVWRWLLPVDGDNQRLKVQMAG